MACAAQDMSGAMTAIVADSDPQIPEENQVYATV